MDTLYMYLACLFIIKSYVYMHVCAHVPEDSFQKANGCICVCTYACMHKSGILHVSPKIYSCMHAGMSNVSMYESMIEVSLSLSLSLSERGVCQCMHVIQCA